MSLLLDARPHAEAIKAALDDPLWNWSAYDFDDVPGSNGNPGKLPGIYVAFTVERRANPLVRNPGRTGSVGWRVALRSVGRTVDECRWAQDRVGFALNEERLPVEGRYSSRLQFESGQAPELDEGRYSALDIYTYRL